MFKKKLLVKWTPPPPFHTLHSADDCLFHTPNRCKTFSSVFFHWFLHLEHSPFLCATRSDFVLLQVTAFLCLLLTFSLSLTPNTSICLRLPQVNVCVCACVHTCVCVCLCVHAHMYVWGEGREAMLDDKFVYINIVCFDVGCF